MRAARRVATVVAIAAACSGCGVSLQSLPQLGPTTTSGYPLHAVFSNVQNLAAHAQVRYGDAVVGTVTSIKARAFQAELTMTIQRRTRLPAGTNAEVRFDTPLGDEYVELRPPSSPSGGTISPGATLGLADTSAAPSVADTLAALGAVLYGGGLAQAHSVVVDVNQILSGNHGQIKELIANLGTVAGSLAGNDAHIDNALSAANQIVTQLNQGHGAVETALATLPPAAAAISADNGQLQALLAGVNKLSPIVLDVLAASGQDLVNDVSQAVPIIRSLAAIQGQFGTDLAQFTQLSKAIQRDAPNGYAQLNVNFTASFPPDLPIPDLQKVFFGCTAPTPNCPPGASVATLIAGALP